MGNSKAFGQITFVAVPRLKNHASLSAATAKVAKLAALGLLDLLTARQCVKRCQFSLQCICTCFEMETRSWSGQPQLTDLPLYSFPECSPTANDLHVSALVTSTSRPKLQEKRTFLVRDFSGGCRFFLLRYRTPIKVARSSVATWAQSHHHGLAQEASWKGRSPSPLFFASHVCNQNIDPKIMPDWSLFSFVAWAIACSLKHDLKSATINVICSGVWEFPTALGLLSCLLACGGELPLSCWKHSHFNSKNVFRWKIWSF